MAEPMRLVVTHQSLPTVEELAERFGLDDFETESLTEVVRLQTLMTSSKQTEYKQLEDWHSQLKVIYHRLTPDCRAAFHEFKNQILANVAATIKQTKHLGWEK